MSYWTICNIQIVSNASTPFADTTSYDVRRILYSDVHYFRRKTAEKIQRHDMCLFSFLIGTVVIGIYGVIQLTTAAESEYPPVVSVSSLLQSFWRHYPFSFPSCSFRKYNAFNRFFFQDAVTSLAEVDDECEYEYEEW